jgi:3-hydroxymyristoyl/3-hydroxydecanoyl-(acyl carrier protein) dehydratase
MTDALRLRAAALSPEPPRELRATFEVGAEHPLLAGHFPGAPVVPGVLLLDAVRRAWQEAGGGGADLRAVDARWLLPVAPGTEVHLRADVVRADGSASLTGECTAAGARVATFALRLQERA